jgi:hypothetical protein
VKIKNVMFIQFAPNTVYGGSARNVREIDAERHGAEMVYKDGLLHVKTADGEAFYGPGVISRMVACPPAPAPVRRRGRPPKSKEVTDET